MKVIIREASEITMDDLGQAGSSKRSTADKIIRLFQGKLDSLWEGINGLILVVKVPTGKTRLTIDQIKKLSKLNIRWMEQKKDTIAIGF